MKNTIRIFEVMRSIAIVALVAVIGFSMVTCSSNPKTTSTAKTPSTSSIPSTSPAPSAPKQGGYGHAGDFSGIVSNDGKSVRITGYQGESKDIRIPSEMWGLPVTSISQEALQIISSPV